MAQSSAPHQLLIIYNGRSFIDPPRVRVKGEGDIPYPVKFVNNGRNVASVQINIPEEGKNIIELNENDKSFEVSPREDGIYGVNVKNFTFIVHTKNVTGKDQMEIPVLIRANTKDNADSATTLIFLFPSKEPVRYINPDTPFPTSYVRVERRRRRGRASKSSSSSSQ